MKRKVGKNISKLLASSLCVCMVAQPVAIPVSAQEIPSDIIKELMEASITNNLLQEVREQARADFNHGTNLEAKSIDLDLSVHTFNGEDGTVIDYTSESHGGENSPYLRVLENLRTNNIGGTIIMKFKTNDAGIIFGAGSTTEDDGSNMVFGLNSNGQLRGFFRNNKDNGMKANLGFNLTDGNWHTVAISFRPGEAENTYVVIDGASNLYNSNWWETWTTGFNQNIGETEKPFVNFEIGGGTYKSFTSGTTELGNFKGEIEFVTVTEQSFTAEQLQELTAPVPSEIQKYSIIFEGGEGAIGTVPTLEDTEQGTSIVLPQNTLTKEEYEFKGWSDGTAIYQPGEAYIMPAQNITFTAVWEASGEINTSIAFEKSEVKISNGQPTTSIDYTGALDKLKDLSKGTITVRYKTSQTGLMSLFSVSNNTQANTHSHVYINGGTIGYEIRNNSTNVNTGSASAKDAAINTWHTVTYVFAENGTSIYYDGEKILNNNKTGFISSSEGVNTVDIGKTSRSTGNNYPFTGEVNYLQVNSDVLTEEQILEIHKATIQESITPELPKDAYKSDDISLFYENYQGSISYRIPSLLTTKNGVVLAAIDKRQSGAADQGNIDTSLRRSYDNGKTWTQGQIVYDLPGGKEEYALTIDPVMLQDEETGRIFMIVDMFPESRAAMDMSLIEGGSGYKQVGDKSYCILRDYESVLNSTHNYTKTYTIREHGEVWLEGDTEADATLTDYTVPDFSTGKLYKDDKLAGNIFLYTGENAGELKVVRNMRLWSSYSDDDGETWSKPVDLTPMVKEEWMKFCGLGPGVGIQVKNGQHKGRLIVPLYVTNGNGSWVNSQASTSMYSDDHGETWKMTEISPLEAAGFDLTTMNNFGAVLTESQILEMNDGTLIQFCRNASGHLKYSISNDSGTTWGAPIQDNNIPDVYCQLTAIHYPNKIDGKEAIILANPDGPSGRQNGMARIGLYNPETQTFEWKYNQLIHSGDYAYSCLSMLADGNIGVLYEATVPEMNFTSFNVEWIKANLEPITKDPMITNVTLQKESNLITFTVDFDSYMFKMGTPILKFTMDGVEKTASYVSGNAAKQYVFQYVGDTAYTEKLIVTNVGVASGDTNSEISNVQGKLPADGSFIFNPDGTADCTCTIEEISLLPNKIEIPLGLSEVTKTLEGSIANSTCAVEGHKFEPVFTYELVNAESAVLTDNQLKVSAAGEVQIRVTVELNGKTKSEICYIHVIKDISGDIGNDAPIAKLPMPEQVVTSLTGTTFTASDIAVDPNGDTMTITKILSIDDSFIIADLSNGAITVYGSKAGESQVLVNVSDGKAITTIAVPIRITEEGAYDTTDYLSNHSYLNHSQSSVGYWDGIGDKIKVDTNQSGGIITLLDENGNHVEFTKGYAAHCTSSLVFDLPENHTYTTFETYYGIDASKSAVAEVTFKISVDGVEKHVSNKALQSTSAMGFASVDITGARTLKLEAIAKDTIGSGHSEWAGSMLIGGDNTASFNTTALKEKVKEAKTYEEAKYSPDSYDTLKAIIVEAEDTIESGIQQIKVFEQLKALITAINNLEKFIPAEQVIINHQSLNMNVGESRKLYVDLLGADGKVSNDRVTWSSSAEDIVTVSESGKITTIAEGQAVITATSRSGQSASCTISVNSVN